MNRRKLFGWLIALPFVPAALAQVPKVVAFAPPTANWGEVNELWIIGANTTEVWMDTEWTPERISDPALSRPLPPGIYRDRLGRFTNLNMKYRPNLPEWF